MMKSGCAYPRGSILIMRLMHCFFFSCNLFILRICYQDPLWAHGLSQIKGIILGFHSIINIILGFHSIINLSIFLCCSTIDYFSNNNAGISTKIRTQPL